MFSLTPPTRAASICMTAIASACSSCLKMTRFCACSPVATRTGATPRAISAWPRTSSGLVGSSIQAMSNSASAFTHAIASDTSQRWFASIAIGKSGPHTSRATRRRRMSSSRSAPTLSLIWPKPSAIASRQSRASFSSE